MASKSSSPKAKRPLSGSPLQKFRALAGWTREECAKHCGTSVASLQNYERGFAPLPRELALALETAGGVSAKHLLEQNKLWLESGGRHSTAELMSMGGFPYRKDTFEKYRSKEINGETLKKSTLDIHTRCRLLLGALTSKPHLFRIAYRKLVQTLEDLRRSSGLSEADLAEFASQGATVEELEWTIGELASESEIAESPRWISEKITERFGILELAKIRKETFDFWPNGSRFLFGEKGSMAPDFELAKRSVWRITLPDGTLLVIPVDNLQASGLVTTTMPEGVFKPVRFSPSPKAEPEPSPPAGTGVNAGKKPRRRAK